ncbi:MAG: ABC transporter ATP-binding protein [Paracoccus sp. (in: a-proteobacteria)]|uniref:ABC transporter ATP-binding protein n=1 Tax=Paracoccus sp. TaxID=267 RepID=UPI0039197F1A
MAELKLTGIAKAYGDVQVLSDINLDITSGEFVVFVGPSGCGKSTLLRMIAGLEQISGGELQIDGQVVNDIPPSQRGIAMVFQSYALYPHMNVRDNMAFALKIAGQSRDQIREATDRAGRMLQLTPYLDRLPKALSGGQRQRVAIGRAIVRDPKVYLFDEPLSNLDAALRVATRIEIAQLKASMPDRTMVYVTHDQTEAMTLADRIVVLAGGGIAQVGAPLELYERPVNEFVAQFIGSPAMNLLPGRVKTAGETTVVALDSGLQAEVAIPTRPGDEGMVVNLGVRPEDMIEAQDGGLFEGEVDLTEALGEVTLLYFGTKADTVPIIAKLPGIHPRLNGRRVRLTADPQALHLFHDGKSLLYRDGVKLPPYQPRRIAPSGSMGGMPAPQQAGGDGIDEGVIKPQGPVR